MKGCILPWAVLLPLTSIGLNFAEDLYFIPTHLSWEDSKRACEASGKELVTIHAEGKLEQMRSFLMRGGEITKYRTWMGLRIPLYSETFSDLEWVDGKPLSVKDWDGDEPNNPGSMKCVLIEAEDAYKWNSRPCDELHPYLCQTVSRRRVSARSGYFQIVDGNRQCGLDVDSTVHTSISALDCSRLCSLEKDCNIVTINSFSCTLIFNSDKVPCECTVPHCKAYIKL